MPGAQESLREPLESGVAERHHPGQEFSLPQELEQLCQDVYRALVLLEQDDGLVLVVQRRQCDLHMTPRPLLGQDLPT